jgi:putrescine aminotransferase
MSTPEKTDGRPDLISLDEAYELPQDRAVDLYGRYVSNSIALFLRILGFDRVHVNSAEGMYLHTRDGRKILDFSGGMNVLNHGHNHPRILAARRRFAERRELEICKAFVPHYQAVLAHNLAQILPGDLERSFFCSSGAEANEGALKIATLFQGPSRDKILYTDMGYHGKTFGTMSVSGPASSPYSELFKGLDGCVIVPWGNLEATRAAIDAHSSGRRNDFACMILEAIKGDLVLRPPEGYLEGLAALLKERDILMIFDEVFTGFGRTGRWFGFEHYGVVPDIVTFSKSVGGGKASIAGYTVPERIFRKTYGKPSRATVHSTTYGGMGEECATAIEAICTMHDEGLVERSARLGQYMLQRMEDLALRRPEYIKEARAIGLLGIFELRRSSELFKVKPVNSVIPVDDLLEGLLQGAISSELLKKHDVLHYTGGREDNIFCNPSLIVTEAEIDRFMDALDEVMKGNLVKIGMSLIANLVRT